MHSTVELSLLCDTETQARGAQNAARAEVERLEALFSDYRDSSEVSRINRREMVALSPETRFLLERAQQVCRETGGAFDVSLGPIKRLWGFGDDDTPHVPDSLEIRKLLEHVGCDVYGFDEAGRFAWHDTEARIDLGGIAQGFVAACLAETLRARGIERFLINISGDIVVGGERPGGGPWRLGVQNPRQTDSLIARFPMRWKSVTTSGDYEQYFVANGQRYHHLFDPATGYPARRSTSVSVFSNDPVDADCYATALFVMGPERGLAFVHTRPDLGALFMREAADGSVGVWRSANLEEDFAPSVSTQSNTRDTR
jgi:thiamine biosynthesis lipoprotein